ncbi:MAG: oligosaccharide flippase family protein [Owenweeksia sp.]
MASNQHSQKKILHNFLSVGFIQAAGMALPLITIPHLIQVLGADGFGIISFALAYTTLFVVLTDYGYNFIGTRKIALLKGDSSAINKVFSTMLTAQVWLTLAGFLIFGISLLIIPDFNKDYPVFLATFGIVIGSTLLPTWFFQGMEKFTVLHWITFVSRAIYTVLIFALVQNENDVLWVPVLNSATTIAAGFFGLLLLLFKFKLRFSFAPFTEVRYSLKEGFNLFISAISTTSIQQLPIIILGFFTSSAIVGYYAFTDKILLVFRLTTQLLSTVIFPKAVLVSQQSYQKIKSFLQNIEKWSAIPLLLASFFLFFLPEMLAYLAPSYTSDIVRLFLKVMAILPPVYMLKLTSEQMLIAFNLTALYRKIMLSSLAFSAVLILVLTWQWGYSGAAAAVVLTEIFIFCTMRWNWSVAKQTSISGG